SGRRDVAYRGSGEARRSYIRHTRLMLSRSARRGNAGAVGAGAIAGPTRNEARKAEIHFAHSPKGVHYMKVKALLLSLFVSLSLAAGTTAVEDPQDRDQETEDTGTASEALTDQDCRDISRLCSENCAELYPDGPIDPGCNCGLINAKRLSCQSGCRT